MGVIELIAAGIGLATLVVKLIQDIRTSIKDGKVADQTHLFEDVRMAAAAAEEMGTKLGWSGAAKFANVAAKFPSVDDEKLKTIINGTVNLLGVGHTAAE